MDPGPSRRPDQSAQPQPVLGPGQTGIAESDALQVANELVASLAQPFVLAEATTHISGSIGIAIYPQHAESVEGLTQCADMAMYAAKRAGKNQVQLWNGG